MEKYTMRRFISHLICQDAPIFPGNPGLEIIPETTIDGGDACNGYIISVFNHFGTHFDAPNHFVGSGLKISELPKERFFYERPFLIDIPKGDAEKILAQDLAPFEEELRRCDLLMIRTGYERFREEDVDRYAAKNPCFGSEAAKWLMEREYFRNIKAIAGDFISFGSPEDPDDGAEAHRILLGRDTGGYICIIEDVSLRDLPAGRLGSAAAIPYFIERIDSAPVTMWAEW